MAPRKPDPEVLAVPVDELVQARYIDVQPVYSPGQGVIAYGDPFLVTAEQLAGDSRLIPWADDWTPDPALVATATLEG